MRLSQYFGSTLREAPSDAEVTSHKLLLRAGYICQLGAGIFSYLHFAHRSLTKIENIMREEINAIGGQEITMPVIHPADVWKETGRWYQIGSEMGRFYDKNNHDMVLAMTHEEVVADITRKHVRSYRQLPMLVYHIQTKWRDDPRPRAGLIRVREFTMKDSYSLDRDEEGLDKQYRAHYQAYYNIFHRCGIPVVSVKSDVGMMGGKMAHEFMYLTPIGEDTLVLCDSCGYTANRQVAVFRKPAAAPEPLQEMQPVETPHTSTIEDLAKFLNIPKSKTAKAVFMVATITEGQEDVSKFVFAVVRGDMEVNETKLANAVKAKALRPAHEEEIVEVGAVPGYASPVGLKDVLVVVDEMVPQSPNLVAGANREGYHLRNVNYGRDYTASIVADIALAEDGHACAVCGSALRTARGVEVGNIFKLGTRYSDALGCTYLDENGEAKPVIMGSYGIGSGRLLACVAEEHNDAYGLKLPITVAPYQVHLIALKGGEAVAEQLYADLTKAGIEVLFDDREDMTAGVRFNDADLIGLPLRVTVSERGLKENQVEIKRRASGEVFMAALAEIEARLKAEIKRLEDEIMAKVVEVPYR
ncbi:MAG: proline--tRNA ligase [Anaerolineae bacterium]|nr:proline--tRNA ligase [Anaerolineae bacterium]